LQFVLDVVSIEAQLNEMHPRDLVEQIVELREPVVAQVEVAQQTQGVRVFEHGQALVGQIVFGQLELLQLGQVRGECE